MRPQSLAARIPGARVLNAGAGENENAEITGVSHDSRAVKPGDLFVCLVGGKFDGHLYARDAVARGAAALLANEGRAEELSAGVTILAAPDTRHALPFAAAAVYGDPSAGLKLIGVTGTNGKTTTANLISAILRSSGLKAGTIGTLGAELMGEPLPSEHTTPEADQLQALLAEMKRRGAEAIAMEVSSHALAQYRTDACRYDAAVFTNLTQDHLDYHGDLESYFAAKLRLFTEYADQSGKPFFASVNADDPRGDMVARATRGKVITYAVQNRADVMAEDVRIEPSRLAFRARTPAGNFDAELGIGGAFQVYNALAAIGVGVGMGLSTRQIGEGLASLASVPGRFESVPTGRGFHVIVDYAHSPDGLENLLSSARRLNPARLLIVFGCGGDRDRTKRPIMGRIAAENADIAVVTSDNPRTEEPNAIIAEILPGMEVASARVIVEPDRRSAIELAIRQAREGDIVLLAGKGHEDYQLVGDKVLPFDDRKVAREILDNLDSRSEDRSPGANA